MYSYYRVNQIVFICQITQKTKRIWPQNNCQMNSITKWTSASHDCVDKIIVVKGAAMTQCLGVVKGLWHLAMLASFITVNGRSLCGAVWGPLTSLQGG